MFIEPQFTRSLKDTISAQEYVKQVKEYANLEKAQVIPLCVKIEEELSSLEGQDKKEMLEALGLEESVMYLSQIDIFYLLLTFFLLSLIFCLWFQYLIKSILN